MQSKFVYFLKERKSNLRLLYRGSRDGFQPSDFHNLCDFIDETVMLIKSDTHHIFGGYTNIPWIGSSLPEASRRYMSKDQSSFVFKFVQREQE